MLLSTPLALTRTLPPVLQMLCKSTAHLHVESQKIKLTGSTDCRNKMTSVIASCPQTKFIVSGYSQGASLCHGIKAGTSVKNAVSSVLLFGDVSSPKVPATLHSLPNYRPP